MTIWFETKRKQIVETDLQGIQIMALSDVDQKVALQNTFMNKNKINNFGRDLETKNDKMTIIKLKL